MKGPLLARLEQNPETTFESWEVRQDSLDTDLLKPVQPPPETIFLDGRRFTIEAGDDDGWVAFDEDDPELPERWLETVPETYQIAVDRLAWRIAAHNAVSVHISRLDRRTISLGEVPPDLGVCLGLFSSEESALAALRAVPSRLPSRLNGCIVICPTLRISPAVERELEALRVTVGNICDDELNLSPRMDVLAARLSPVSKVMGNDPGTGLRWGIGFLSVAWRSEQFDFTPPQGAVVELLFDAWKNRTPFLHQSAVLERIGSGASELRDLFRNHRAWGRFIVSGPIRGTFGLSL